MRRVNYLITLVVTLIIFTEQSTGQENYPRTTSGRPDFNGHYDISTLTPFERPASFGNRQALNEEEVGTPMLVPVTESLYVPGKVGATDKVLVDIGTGYFVEKTPKGAEEYCKKKVQELRVNMERIMNVVQQKRKQLVMVSEQLSKRGQ